MRKILFILIAFSLSASLHAQNILDEIRQDKPGQGHVTITQTQEIEELVKQIKEEPVAKPSATPSESSVATSDMRRNPVTDVEADASVSTTHKMMRRSYKAQGYRIQLYSGGNKRVDREKCEQIARQMKASFPNMPVYVHFYSPSWKCRAGNFTSHEEASKVLQQVRRMGYTQACLVKGTVNVQY